MLFQENASTYKATNKEPIVVDNSHYLKLSFNSQENILEN